MPIVRLVLMLQFLREMKENLELAEKHEHATLAITSNPDAKASDHGTLKAIPTSTSVNLETREKTVVRVDRNFSRYPIFTTQKFKGHSREIIIRSRKEDGSIDERCLSIGKTHRHREVGVLTATHAKVFYVLLKIWEENDHPFNEPVRCSLYRIAQYLGLKWNQRASKQIKQVLADLKEIPITWHNAFWQAKTQTFAEQIAFRTILSNLHIMRVEKGKKVYGTVEYQIDTDILNNVLGTRGFPLRLEVLVSLKKEMATLLYPVIERQLAKKTEYQRDLVGLWDDLDLSHDYIRKPSDYKTKVKAALEELEGKPFNWGILTYAQAERKANGKGYKAVFKRKRNESQLKGKRVEMLQAITEEEKKNIIHRFEGPPKRPLNRHEVRLVKRIRSYGFPKRNATELVRRHGYAEIKRILGHVDQDRIKKARYR